MQRLCETYDRCADRPQFENDPLMPIGLARQQAHVEVVLDGGGQFRRASVLHKEETEIPATEDSAGRTSTPVPHGLCDKIQYCAGDYLDFTETSTPKKQTKETPFSLYINQLTEWQQSYPTPKAQVILRYVTERHLVADLVKAGVLCVDTTGKLAQVWTGQGDPPLIFKMLTAKDGRRDQGGAFVRWRIEGDGSRSAVWNDPDVIRSWVQFQSQREAHQGLCQVTGEETTLAENHPKRLRHGADGAKLISSNDKSGFTFRGRFESAEQACGIGSEATQKAHNALRWLIHRQGSKSADEEVFVAWSVDGNPTPDPFDMSTLYSDSPVEEPEYEGDAGQYFAIKLRNAIAGYRANLSTSPGVMFMGLDAATPGRMAVTYYREFAGSDFCDRLERWYQRAAWFLRTDQGEVIPSTPTPSEIAEAAYGKRARGKSGAKLRKATVERLLPCIVDGRPVPRDLVWAAVRSAQNRVSWKDPKKKGEPDWEKCLGIACAVFRAGSKEEYSMSLEPNRPTRCYLYGRLLAIAEDIESRALYLSGQSRDTNAARLMQRFASHPFSTWRNIELSLRPYEAQLRSSRGPFLASRKRTIEEIHALFEPAEYMNDREPLTGEFLLGYYCQRAALRSAKKVDQQEGTEDSSL